RLDWLPEWVAIIGSGYIGLEFSDVYTPQILMDDLKRLDEFIEQQTAKKDFPYQMIGRRLLRQHNTWTQNAYRLSKGRNQCTLLINNADAQKLGIANGDYVCVQSRVGEVTVEAETTDDIMEGVVSLPQGFGASKKSKMKVAAAQNSVSINDLTDHMRVDALTGNAALNGVGVKVLKVS
ncbi:MAG: molybdopterin dinucleotide binding domain-containing protein, partial [Bacteroidota bacterium]